MKRQPSRVLLACLFLACSASTSTVSTRRPVTQERHVGIASAECYALRYPDLVGPAALRLYPIWMMLLPGADSGAAVGRHHPQLSDDDWATVSKYAGWKRNASDSLDVIFSGNNEGIRIRVARAEANLKGRTILLTDIVGLPQSSVRLIGNREQCTQ